MSESSVIIHENTFGSYSRIASDLMESYLQRERDGDDDDDDSSSIITILPTMILSLFSANSVSQGVNGNQSEYHETQNWESKENPMQFIINAIDYDLISLIFAIKR